MKNPSQTERHLFVNKMYFNLDVLHTTMLSRVARHVDSADIVTKDESGGVEGAMKLMKKLTKPRTFSHNVSHDTIVGFVTGARDCSLAFGDQDKGCHRDIHNNRKWTSEYQGSQPNQRPSTR